MDTANFEVRKTVKLNSGYQMPTLGLGTWTLTGATCETAVYQALKCGYRLIDAAKYYGNEQEVGNAVKKAVNEGICTREEVFITTKIVPWTSNPAADIDNSLQKLQTTYIDLCLLHQHGSAKEDDAVYKAMVQAVKDGKIRSIGISNYYTEKDVEKFIDGYEIPPAVVQNENHIFYQNNTLRDCLAARNIYVESYYPFGGRGHTGDHFGNPVILEIAAAHNKTAAQVLVRWHLQSGYIAIPGSGNSLHIAENFDIWNFELSGAEMRRIAALNTGRRYENW